MYVLVEGDDDEVKLVLLVPLLILYLGAPGIASQSTRIEVALSAVAVTFVGMGSTAVVKLDV